MLQAACFYDAKGEMCAIDTRKSPDVQDMNVTFLGKSDTLLIREGSQNVVMKIKVWAFSIF